MRKIKFSSNYPKLWGLNDMSMICAKCHKYIPDSFFSRNFDLTTPEEFVYKLAKEEIKNG